MSHKASLAIRFGNEDLAIAVNISVKVFHNQTEKSKVSQLGFGELSQSTKWPVKMQQYQQYINSTNVQSQQHVIDMHLDIILKC